jgi:diguanylate cyclase (GGDEF)-like protein
MRSSPERALTRLTVPAAALLALALALGLPDNSRLWDSLNRALPGPPDPRVVVVGIDDASLRDYGPLTGWPRELYGQALRTLDEAGVQTIGLDVRLSDLARTQPELEGVFARPNVVLSSAPGASPQSLVGQRTPTGVNALNTEPGGVVRRFQTAYPDADGTLWPSFARQLAVSAGQTVPLDTLPRLLRHVRNDPTRLAVLPFRDVVNGNVRFGDLQGRVVLIGLTAGSLPGTTRLDPVGEETAGVVLQARAVSTLLGAPLVGLPLWLTALLCVAVAVLAVLVRGLWGFVIALAALALAAPLWLVGVLFPGITVSLAAIVGSALVALERSWTLRTLGTRDPLTGSGNRLAFTRAVEHRWPGRKQRPIGLLLVDLSGFRQVNETYGRAAGDEVLRDLAARLQAHKRRGDVVFRWGPDEFAVLLDNVGPPDLQRLGEGVGQALSDLGYRDLRLRASVGAAATGPEITTPAELVEAASRSRYRMKYQREQREGESSS